jgi:hypothetical protein
MSNPLSGIAMNEVRRLNELRGEYLAEARSSAVRKAINAELGAYFALAHKLPDSPPGW